jgi:hypothetical protein
MARTWGVSHHLPPYSILCTSPWGPHPNDFLSRDSHSPKLGLPQLWSHIILRVDLGSRCNIKQSCSPYRQFSNGMLHAVCRQVNRVDFRLFLVRSQIGSLTPDPSFGHNLCFRCPNKQYEPIFNIYVLRAFQWYKKCHKPLSFDPWNRSLKFWESIRTLSPKVGVALGVWGFTPSHFPTLLGVCDATPRLSFGSHLCNPFALVASPKLGLQHAPPHFLKDSNASPKVEIVKKEGVGVHSLVCKISGVKGCAGTPRWGLGRVTNGSIIHTILHKLNNKLVSVWLEHFWCTHEPQAYTNS